LYQLNQPCEFSTFFWLSKICFSLTDIVSSLSPPQCCLSSDRSHHDAAPCGTSFPWSQNELAASTSSFGNASSHCLPSRAKIEVLNLHHRGSHPPQTGRLLPSSAIKMSSQPFHSPYHSTASPFCLLPSQSTTPSELHPSSSFPFTIVPRLSSLNTTTPTVMN
jgi:hypothetical protein